MVAPVKEHSGTFAARAPLVADGARGVVSGRPILGSRDLVHAVRRIMTRAG